jgi:hypothetical protein
MTLSITLVFYILAAVCFALAAVGASPRISWRDAGFFFLTLSLFVK